MRGAIDVSFTGSSTLHDFEGTLARVSIALRQEASGAWSADVAIPVAQLDTGNGWRDADMREMFEADRHPRIRARFRDVDAGRVRETGVLPFVLTIRDVEQPLEAMVTGWQQSERSASFDAAFAVSLERFRLTAPRTLFLRVGDTVRVRVHVTLERA